MSIDDKNGSIERWVNDSNKKDLFENQNIHLLLSIILIFNFVKDFKTKVNKSYIVVHIYYGMHWIRF